MVLDDFHARGVSEKISLIAMDAHEMWKDHPINFFAVMKSFADENPRTLRAMLRAIREAGEWCDDFAHREELARIGSVHSWMNAPVPSIRTLRPRPRASAPRT